jgi:hypothetical protein
MIYKIQNLSKRDAVGMFIIKYIKAKQMERVKKQVHGPDPMAGFTHLIGFDTNAKVLTKFIALDIALLSKIKSFTSIIKLNKTAIKHMVETLEELNVDADESTIRNMALEDYKALKSSTSTLSDTKAKMVASFPSHMSLFTFIIKLFYSEIVGDW